MARALSGGLEGPSMCVALSHPDRGVLVLRSGWSSSGVILLRSWSKCRSGWCRGGRCWGGRCRVVAVVTEVVTVEVLCPGADVFAVGIGIEDVGVGTTGVVVVGVGAICWDEPASRL